MKIIPEQLMNNRDVLRKQNLDKKGAQPESAAKSAACDKITIEARQSEGLSDAQFIAQLKKGILSDIQAGASERKLDDLRQQIALGEYDVNASDVAKRIMNVGPEANYE